MKILGLHINGQQTSAALLEDGRVIHGIAEERLNRDKQSNAFPLRAAKWCLGAAGLGSIEEVDAVAISWSPAHSYISGSSGMTSWRGIVDRLAHAPHNLASLMPRESVAQITASKLGFSTGGKPDVFYVDHHLSHLAMAKYQSPFEEAAVLIADEYAEKNSLLFSSVRNNDVEVLATIPFPHSLGIMYATFTEFLGFQPNSDEWKIMGAAAYGNAERFESKIRSLMQISLDPLEFELDLNFFEFQNTRLAGYSTAKLDNYLGATRPTGDLEQIHYDLAAGCQKVFEDVLFVLLRWLYQRTHCVNLAAAGGCFMNSLANGKILANTPFKNLFVPYAAADNGGAVGAALWVYHQIVGAKHVPSASPPTALLGPSYSNEEIVLTLERFKLPFAQMDDVIPATIEALLAQQIVGWFQGPMEFGERALGCRSILADPRDGAMKDRINSAVKYREAYRPFAPSVLEHRAHDWFEIPPQVRVPYMEQVFPFKADARASVPAVVHADGTGRLQTVSREDNPLYFKLIEAFEAATGVPILLNTSFNVKGEPIVCSPADALRTFFTSGLDVLVMGNCIIRKADVRAHR